MQKVKMLFLAAVSCFLFAAAYRLLAVPSAQAQSPAGQEVAFLTGTLPDGGTIPLPHYADGTEALESECQWTVSIDGLTFRPSLIETLHCSSDGRTVHVWSCGSSDTSACAGTTPGTANYVIIGSRSSTTSTTPSTWGQVKARWSDHGVPQQGEGARPGVRDAR